MKMEGTMKNRTHTVRCTLPKPDSRSLVGRSINYESNGVRCIIGPGRGLERRGNGADRAGTEKK